MLPNFFRNNLKSFIVIIAIFGIAYGLLYFSFYIKKEINPVDWSCVETEMHKVKGNSMEPLIPNGQEVKLLKGYYNCNDFQRGDIVVFQFKTREELFIKRLAAIPQDKLQFEDSNLKVNNEILKNSSGQAYQFNGRARRILEIPLQNNEISQGRYLVLGEKASPLNFDSRSFGYLEKEHIIGKVLTQE
jgi:signal peptidase I